MIYVEHSCSETYAWPIIIDKSGNLYPFQGVPKGQKLKVAIIGQSAFAAEVYKLIKKDGHQVVGVFTVPDNGNREDPAGECECVSVLNSRP